MGRCSDLLPQLREMRQRDATCTDLLLLRDKAWNRLSYLKRLGRHEGEEAVELRAHLEHIAPLLKRAHTRIADEQDEGAANVIAATRRMRARNQSLRRIVLAAETQVPSAT